MANDQLNATLKLYNVPFTQEDNFILDEPLTYLNSLTPLATVEDFQFSYPEMKKTIKLRLDGMYITSIYARPIFNYVLVESVNHLSGSTQTNRALYFVDDVQWVDSDTVRLSLSYDTLNGFVLFVPSRNSANIPWEDHTHISRQHKDRYIYWDGYKSPKIDFKSEGITTTKEKTSDTQITTSQGKFYIMFKADHKTGVVKRLLFTEKPYTIQTSETTERIPFSKLSEGQYWAFKFTASSGSVYFNGDSYNYSTPSGGIRNAGVIIYLDGQTVKLALVTINGTIVAVEDSQPLHSVNAYFSTTNTQVYILSSLISYTNEWDTYAEDLYYTKIGNAKIFQLKDVVRTYSQILKIVEYPYLPIEVSSIGNTVITFNNDVTYEGGYIVLDDYAQYSRCITNFTLSDYVRLLPIGTPTAAQLYGSLSDYAEEPKLFHSDFYNVKVIFDSFFYEIPLERLKANDLTTWSGVSATRFSLTIYPSLNISSTFLFKVDNPVGINSNEDYDGYIAVRRNNEVALYTDSYLEYIRSGYNFDVKQKALQENAQLASTLISAVGMVASFASSVYTGGAGVAAGVALATSLTASATSYAHTISSNEVSMASKLASLQNQGASVSGAEDLGLMNVYSKFAKVVIYSTVPHERKLIINTLRLKGYACDDYAIPNTHTRLYFNYVQCEAEFLWTIIRRINDTIVTDVKQRFSQGVTFLHSVNGSYDFERKYENWENALLN